jgi:hypothetical protein
MLFGPWQMQIAGFAFCGAQVAALIEAWLPGFGLPEGSSATMTVAQGLPPLDQASLGGISFSGSRVDGMRLSVDGSSLISALRWSGTTTVRR